MGPRPWMSPASVQAPVTEAIGKTAARGTCSFGHAFGARRARRGARPGGVVMSDTRQLPIAARAAPTPPCAL